MFVPNSFYRKKNFFWFHIRVIFVVVAFSVISCCYFFMYVCLESKIGIFSSLHHNILLLVVGLYKQIKDKSKQATVFFHFFFWFTRILVVTIVTILISHSRYIWKLNFCFHQNHGDYHQNKNENKNIFLSLMIMVMFVQGWYFNHKLNNVDWRLNLHKW